jgi:hypothetical protein
MTSTIGRRLSRIEDQSGVGKKPLNVLFDHGRPEEQEAIRQAQASGQDHLVVQFLKLAQWIEIDQPNEEVTP